jgi:hypothetical protein
MTESLKDRRTGSAVRTVGLVAMLGVGVGVAAGCAHDDGATNAHGGRAAVASPASAAPDRASTSRSLPVSPSPVASTSPSSAPSSRPAATRPSDSLKAQEEIMAAREKAAKEGHPLQRALSAKGNALVNERTENTSEGTVKVVTAKADLTGQRELLMAADDGTPIGQARCTQRLRFANAAAPREVPTVLLCWRVSAQRSVVTFAVSKTGKPSPQLSASIIKREWARL